MRGDYTEVWLELGQYADIRANASVFADAVAVATETMRRAGANIEVLINGLRSKGYVFGTHRDGSRRERYVAPFLSPKSDTPSKIAELEQMVGRLPLSLTAWWLHVGSVDLRGHGLGLPPSSDAFMIYSVDDILEDAHQWKIECNAGAIEDASQFPVNLSPDRIQKDEASGAGYYSLIVPEQGADGSVLLEQHSMMFVDYIRLNIMSGGFPRVAGSGSAVDRVLAAITSTLMPM